MQKDITEGTPATICGYPDDKSEYLPSALNMAWKDRTHKIKMPKHDKRFLPTIEVFLLEKQIPEDSISREGVGVPYRALTNLRVYFLS